MTQKPDAFLDTNIFFEWLTLSDLERMISLHKKGGDNAKEKIYLTYFDQQNLDKDMQAEIIEIERAEERLLKLYDNLSTANLYITKEVKRQLENKNILNNVTQVEIIVKRRLGEYAFTQLKGPRDDFKKKADKNIRLFLNYKKSFNLLQKTIDSVYLPSEYCSAVEEFLEKINHHLRLEENHKYDYGTDLKLVACVLDNCLNKKNDSRLLSQDKGIKRLLNLSIGLISAMKELSPRIKEFSKTPPFSYSLDAEGEVIPDYEEEDFDYLNYYTACVEDYLSKAYPSADFERGPDAEYEHNNLTGYLGASTIRLLNDLHLID